MLTKYDYVQLKRKTKQKNERKKENKHNISVH